MKKEILMKNFLSIALTVLLFFSINATAGSRWIIWRTSNRF